MEGGRPEWTEKLREQRDSERNGKRWRHRKEGKRNKQKPHKTKPPQMKTRLRSKCIQEPKEGKRRGNRDPFFSMPARLGWGCQGTRSGWGAGGHLGSGWWLCTGLQWCSSPPGGPATAWRPRNSPGRAWLEWEPRDPLNLAPRDCPRLEIRRGLGRERMGGSLHASFPWTLSHPAFPVLLVSEAASGPSQAHSSVYLCVLPALCGPLAAPLETQAGHRAGSHPPHRAIWTRSSPHLLLWVQTLPRSSGERVKPPCRKQLEMEPNTAFSPRSKRSYTGQTTVFGPTPPPLTGTGQPQLPRREGLSSSKKGPSSHLPVPFL